MSKFQAKTIARFKADGWIVLNTIKLSESGYPDLICLKDGKTLFIECKENGDTLKALQEYRIDQLISQGFEAYCLHATRGQIYPPCTQHSKQQES